MKHTWILIPLLAMFPFWNTQGVSSQSGGRPAKVTQYLVNHRFLAVELHEQTGIPMPIIFAVAGLESDWGKSELAKMSNNHFGIKSKNWKGQVYCKDTQEFYNGVSGQYNECFRKYPLIRHSYEDFGRFLKQEPYARLFNLETRDYDSWAKGLQYFKYATDPEYADKLVDIIVRYELYRF